MDKILYCFLIFILFFTHTCAQNNKQQAVNQPQQTNNQPPKTIIDSSGQILESRILPSEGFERIAITQHSFAAYLRQLPLKPHGAEVLLYDGRTKHNYNVYEAVIDLPIGKRDLHQCADAIMRLRAEYLWNKKQYDEIHFNFTNGFRADYSKWMNGQRIAVNGNQVSWTSRRSPSNTYTDFWKYMEMVFAYAGTLSLDKELHSINLSELSIGDVFIHGGSPGHAIIIVDMAIHPETNKKIFLLAQSYMPAQEIQILKNPMNENISPWYATDFGEILSTPEWTFKRSDLKRF